MSFGSPRHERSNGFGSFSPREPQNHYSRERKGITHGVHFFNPVRFRLFGINFYFSPGRMVGIIASFFALLIMGISIFGLFSGYKNNKETINNYKKQIERINIEISNENAEFADLKSKFENSFFENIIYKASLLEEDDNYYLSTGVFENNFSNAINNNFDITNTKAQIEKVSGLQDVYQIKFIVNPYDINSEELPEDVIVKLVGGAGVSQKLFTTYAMYTSYDIEKNIDDNIYFENDGILSFDIAIAVIDNEIYAINLDFNKDKALENEELFHNYVVGEYNKQIANINVKIKGVEEKIKTNKVSIGILFTIVGILVLLLILSLVKVIKNSIKRQKHEDAMAEAEVQEAQAIAQAAQARAGIEQEKLDRKYRYCKYCGAKVNEDENKCPNCGSVVFEVKK